jgi:hypothetical protein
MLGKLFSLGTGAPSGSTVSLGTGHDAQTQTFVSLESVQEDVHTRNLLFPDADALYQSRNGQVFSLSCSTDLPQSLAQHPFDDRGDLDLELRDVRILIMQDALGSFPSTLLYDSHAPAHTQEQQGTSTVPPNPGSTSGGGVGVGASNAPESRKIPVSPRKGSTSSIRTQTDSPQPRQGAFDRRASLHGGRGVAFVETELQKSTREYREEISTFSGCVFGNSELMAYKGTSTKVHIMPSNAPEQPRSEWRPEWNSMFGDGRGSAGRAKGNRFSQSYTSDTASPMQAPLAPPTHQSPTRQVDRQRILITRLFPVALPTDDADSGQLFSPQGRAPEDGSGFPFPQTSDDAPKKKKPQPRQKRTPMYAIVLAISLPQAPPNTMLAPHKSNSTMRGPGSYNEQDSFPSSYGSLKRSGWSANYNDLTESAFAAADVEDRIDALTQHWDIIMRTLTSLQSKMTTLLMAMLRCAAISTPDPHCQVPPFVAQRNPSLGPRRPEDVSHVKPSKSNAKHVHLQPSCLAQDQYIARKVDEARNRIVTGLGAARVATGQGRWGMWRDEVRSMVRLSSKKERETFFISLLTGFLSTHTDWLLALSPVAYRKRHILQQRGKTDDEVALSSRTIIVANDKMMARRLIFLLSAFLPTNQPMPVARAHRPSTAASGPTSNSPPSFIVPLFREESLRKRINRRGVSRHSRTASACARGSGVPATLAHLTMDDGTNRRGDPDTTRPVVIPMLASDSSSNRKSTAIATAMPPETLVPHFVPIVRLEEVQGQGVGKKSCTASTAATDDLKRSLKRGESASSINQPSSDPSTQSQSQSQNQGHGQIQGQGQGHGQASGWGSVISGLWPGKKTPPSTAASSAVSSQHSGKEDSMPAPRLPSFSHHAAPSKANKLEHMVNEVTVPPVITESRPKPSAAVNVHVPEGLRGLGAHQLELESTARLLGLDLPPDPTGAFVSAIKTTINEDDGVIDVDVPFPDFVTASETAVSSPSSSGYLSTPGFGGLESFEHASRMTVDGDLPLNVAGWLPSYHPDFALQAIPDQEGLMDAVKASLRAEPSPTVVQTTENEPDRWVDVSSAIVANTMTNKVTRIRYRRLIRPKSIQERHPIHHGAANIYGTATPSAPNHDNLLEEEFITETVDIVDNILAEAVDKVTGLHGTDTPSTSQGTILSGTAASQSTDAGSADGASQSLEVPREQCKTVVLSALEAVIRTTIEATEREAQARPGAPRNIIIKRDSESLLREAVRGWLQGIDMGD